MEGIMHGNIVGLSVRATTTTERVERLAFAASVRTARAILNLSQSDLGAMLGITQRTIHRIEQGNCEPRITTVIAVESLFKRAGLLIEYKGDGGFAVVVPSFVLLKA
jgi:DNA-binding XRE family transcriptional regulator